MVGQPSKYTLARARYLLFETFCWPTMYHQTNHNFYWFLLVDPGLDNRIINDIKALLQTMPSQNAFMVLTNKTEWAADGVGVENVSSYGVGLRTLVEEYRNEAVTIVTGNTSHLQQAWNIMNGQPKQQLTTTKPILSIETLLDADDGLNNHGVDWIQDVAVQRTRERQDYMAASRSIFDVDLTPNLNDTWWFLCGTDHIEWHNRDIYRVSTKQYAITGVSGGLTGVRSNPYFCTSAGFTRIGLTQRPSDMKFPKDAYSNHALAFYFPPCTSANQLSIIPKANITLSRCWRREFPNRPFIMKSRTIGSDSMDNMDMNDRDYRDIAWLNATDQPPLLINETENAWMILHKDFSVNRQSAWMTSVYFYENRKQILRDNMESRCSPGFPCYKTAKKNLARLERYWKHQELEEKHDQQQRRTSPRGVAWQSLSREGIHTQQIVKQNGIVTLNLTTALRKV